MKGKISKRLLSLILAVIMVVSVVPMGVFEASAANMSIQDVATLTNFRPGDHPGLNCKTFCNAVWKKLYGTDLGSQKENQIELNVGSANYQVGRTLAVNDYTFNLESVSSLLKQAVPGDVMQFKSNKYTLHAIMIYSNNGTGLTIYDCIRIGGIYTVRLKTYNTYREFYNGWFNCTAGEGISLYRSPKNDQGDTGSGGTGSGGTGNGGNDDPHVNKNAVKATGTYRSNGSSVALRSEPATITGYRHFYIPKYTEIFVTETKYNWGKCTYKGVTGWTCLDYYTQVSIPDAGVPRINEISTKDVSQGSLITVNWAAVSNATKYKISVNGGSEIDIGNNTTYSLKLDQAKTYSFKVQAYNSANKASGWSNTVSCTAHAPCQVRFVDYDGSEIETVTVKYGESARTPNSPVRKGYTFRGWNGSYYNVKSDIIIKAEYKINTYTVNFYGQDGKLLETAQKVNYGGNATPPDPNTPDGYTFLGWDSDEYLEVYTDKSDKTIDIHGIYQWANSDLPVVCTITSAMRQGDGYYVYFDLENKVDKVQKGRAVVALKTSDDKLVDITESTAFSIGGNAKKTGMEVFVPSSSAASSVEVIIVADYATGVPISSLSVCESIYNADNWSDWQIGTLPSEAAGEERTLYRYRDKEFSTGTRMTKDGWTYTGVRNETLVRRTGFQDTKLTTYDNETGRCSWINTRTVDVYGDRTVYIYYHYHNPAGGSGKQHYWCPTYHGAQTDYGVAVAGKWSYHTIVRYNEPLTDWGASSCNSAKRKYKDADCPYCTSATANQYWFLNNGYPQIEKNVVIGTKEQYDYSFYEYTYNFYRWKPWSDWSTATVTKLDNREIQTQTQYRTMGTDAGVEDESGVTRTEPINLPESLAGKQVTLSVYGYTGASDYTNFYIGQKVLDENGDCVFKYKLREEPSKENGDLTVAIGIEGTDYMQVVRTIKVDKPTYKVIFRDLEDKIISEQTITEGENAVVPEATAFEGYTFIGWDKSATNITSDIEIKAEYEKNTYTVIFIDWHNKLYEVKTFEHGAPLTAPDIAYVTGYDFAGWDKIIEGHEIVTKDMVVTAEYDKKVFTVTFCDFDGNPVSIQEIEYGDSALPPELDDGENGEQFAGWFDPDEYEYVDNSIVIYPSFYFEETTDLPEASYCSGEYDGAIELELTTTDENAVIYYYLGDDQSTEAIYTEPITIDKSTTVTYYATSFGKNDSEAVTGYYCINNDEVSGWMLQSALPADVTANPDDYIVESAKGYRYKDTQSTELVSVYKPLLNNGWKWESSTWSSYTAWQDAEIVADSKYIEHQVETREVDDTSVTWYKYTRYKYIDSNGAVQYSPTAVEGYECTEETLRIPDKLSIAGFLDDDVTTYYEYNGERWFKRTTAAGLKTQYRSRYKICTYYKWTEWGTTAPTSTETRAYETDTVYRYSVQNYHIVDIVTGFGDMPITSLMKSGMVYDTSALEIEGYTFDGLYTNEALTTAFGATTPITESVTLYAKYTPKKYTVRFQMQDGTTIPVQMQDGTEAETQQVDYLGSATEPEKDAIPNWTFVSWDKDFDCITGDTVITGKYIKNTEYAYINFDRTSADMYQGMSFTLVYLITPLNLANETVEWSTSDPSIATVDDKGKVTAISAGEATITATVVKSKQKATCTINVTADKANYIVLKSDTYLGYDSLGYLRGVKLKTTTSDLSREFANVTLIYQNMYGSELGEDSLISTGSTIMLYNGSKLVDSKSVVVTGDVYPDGAISNKDVALMLRVMLNKTTVEECQQIAMDVNGDGYINNKDAAMVARYMVGKENF